MPKKQAVVVAGTTGNLGGLIVKSLVRKGADVVNAKSASPNNCDSRHFAPHLPTDKYPAR
jgi:NAD(P)-dependent dehydrogenase (short-subunit alcohol dehydrogenase family)